MVKVQSSQFSGRKGASFIYFSVKSAELSHGLSFKRLLAGNLLECTKNNKRISEE
jgi:hypothetical protein